MIDSLGVNSLLVLINKNWDGLVAVSLALTKDSGDDRCITIRLIFQSAQQKMNCFSLLGSGLSNRRLALVDGANQSVNQSVSQSVSASNQIKSVINDQSVIQSVS